MPPKLPLMSGMNYSLVPDVFRKTFRLSGVVFAHLLVVRKSLHHADVSVQWYGAFYQEAIIPGDEETCPQRTAHISLSASLVFIGSPQTSLMV